MPRLASGPAVAGAAGAGTEVPPLASNTCCHDGRSAISERPSEYAVSGSMPSFDGGCLDQGSLARRGVGELSQIQKSLCKEFRLAVAVLSTVVLPSLKGGRAPATKTRRGSNAALKQSD